MIEFSWARRTADHVAGADIGSLGPGLIGGLLTSLCCLPPALALVFGLGAGGTALLATLGAHEAEILLAGVGFTLAAAWWTLRRQEKACRIDRNPLPFFLRALGAFVASYLIVLTIAHVVTPFLAGGLEPH